MAVAEFIANHGVAIPMFPELTKEERQLLYRLLDPEKVSEVFAYLEDVGDYLEEMSVETAADIIEHYKEKMDAFQFIKDVPCDWERSLYLEAEPGEYIVTARQAKGKDEWYIGCTAGDHGHSSNIKLDFLTPGVKYEATIYADAKGTAWNNNPEAYVITMQKVTSKTVLKNMTAGVGGGWAISVKAIDK